MQTTDINTHNIKMAYNMNTNNTELPIELWMHIVEYDSERNAAVLLSKLGITRQNLTVALLKYAAGQYVYVCPVEKTISQKPCMCRNRLVAGQEHTVQPVNHQGQFLCREHQLVKCFCDKSSQIWFSESEILRRTDMELNHFTHVVMSGDSELVHFYVGREVARKRMVRKHTVCFWEESDDLCLDVIFYPRKLKTLGPKGADVVVTGPDTTGAGQAEPDAQLADTADLDGQQAPPPGSIDPVTQTDELPVDAVPPRPTATLVIPPVRQTDPAAQPEENSGYRTAPAISNERSGEPVDAPAHTGWLSWEDGSLGGNATYYAGSIVRSTYEHTWNQHLQANFNTKYPPGSTIEQNVRSMSLLLTPQFTADYFWGYGAPSPEAEITKAGFVDSFTVVQMTHVGKTILIPVSRETIGYNVPFGLSVYNRTMPFNSLASITPTSDLYAQIRHRKVTDDYHRMILTASQRGNNHIALGATMYMRLMAVRVAQEQGANPFITVESEGFNRFLGAVGSADSVLVETARTFAANTPMNMVTMPRNAVEDEHLYMYYLCGNTRLRIPWQQDANSPVKDLFSCLDAYVPEQRFILTPIANDQRIEPLPVGTDRIKRVDSYLLETIVAKYFTTHNLWGQLPVMRAFAWAILAHPATAVNIKFPAPMHTSELQLNLWPNTTASRVGRILGDKDHFTSLHVATVIAARNCEEVLTDAIVSATTAVGIPYTHPAYKATVEQELGRHLYNGYAHLIQPVIEHLLDDSFPELTQFLSDSILSLEKCTTGRSLDTKLFRASSYLVVNEEPEGEGWQLVFSENKRKTVAGSRRLKSREALVATWLTEKSLIPRASDITYYQHETAEVDSTVVLPVMLGNTGKNKLTNLAGRPQLWDYFVRGLTGLAAKSVVPPAAEKNVGSSSLAELFRDIMAEAEANMENPHDMFADDGEEENVFEDDEPGLPEPEHEEGEQPEENIFEEPNPKLGEGKKLVTPKPKPDQKPSAVETGEPSNKKGKQPVEAPVPKPEPKPEDNSEPKKTGEKGFLPVSGGVRETQLPRRSMNHCGLYNASVRKTIPAPLVQKPRKKGKPKRVQKPVSVKDDESWYQPKNARGADEHAVRQTPQRHMLLLGKNTLNAAEVKELDLYYPRGADGALKRAPYTAAHFWVKRRNFTHETRRHNDLHTAYKNAAYGKNAWLVTLGMFILTHTLTDGAYARLIALGLLTTPYELWNSKWAAFNDLIRNEWADGKFKHTSADLPQMLYLANMVGRAHRDVEWDDEVAKRKRVLQEVKIPAGQVMRSLTIPELETEIMKTLMQEGSIRVKNVQSFEQFYRARANWMIKGSASGERMLISEYKDIVKELKELNVAVRPRAAKTDVAEYVSHQAVLDVLDDTAVHLAKAHTKGNEHGKLRAIYGSLYTHYVLGSFWSEYLEDTIQLKSASMNKDNSVLLEESLQRSQSCQKGRWVVCLDYADFNAQHSGAAQECVLNTVYKWACLKGFVPTEEFQKIHKWYAKSFTNQWFQRPDNHEWVRASSGMFSGVRQTTMFNTILNLTYHRLYLKACWKMGSMVRCPVAYVLGDDGWVEFYTEEEARQYLAAAVLGGMEINALKQLLSRGRGEYLRLIYDTDGMIRGCPVRSLSSFVHGNVETNTPSMGAQRIAEMYSQACMLVRRGLDRRAWQIIFEDLAIYEIGYTGIVTRKQCMTYLYGTKTSGALGLMPIDKKRYTKDSLAGQPEAVTRSQTPAETLAALLMKSKIAKRFKASNDFADMLEREYSVVWKHEGKLKATAIVAAQNLTDGSADRTTAHEELLAKVLTSRVDKNRWADALKWNLNVGGPSIGPVNIEKQYRKQRISEERIISLVTRIASVSHYITDDSKDMVIQTIAAKLDVPLPAVRSAFKSSATLKGAMVDYIPKPDLVPEMEGVYTQWLVINKDTTRQTTIPRWVSEYSELLKY
nr:hypothetical protein [Didymella theifolia botybirnavirus 1]